MDTIRNFIDTAAQWLGPAGLAALALVGGLVVARIVAGAFRKALQRLPPESLRHATLDATSRPVVWGLRLLALWIALNVLRLPAVGPIELSVWVAGMLQPLTIGLATWLGVRLVGEACAVWARRASTTQDTFDDQLVPIVRKTAKVALVVVGVVMILQNMGYPVGSLLAGLGIGGAALAFASKDTIANFFGSIVIFIDRPFQIGDWVEIGDVEGTVEEVDIRTTRIRTFANSLITVPNSQMTVTAIQNWSRMKKRRIKLDVGVAYGASAQQMRAAVAAIRGIIDADERLHQDFYLVNFHELGESSLNIFCYLFTRTTNWAEYMQIREDFLLSVMEAVADLGLEIAFPTRTIHVVQSGGGAGSSDRALLPPGAGPAMQRQTPR